MSKQIVKPFVPANALIFFNSKLVHANTPSKKPRDELDSSGNPLPNRLAVAVAFSPKSRRSQATLKRKRDAYFAGRTSNHWPCDRFSLKLPRVWDHIKGGKKLPTPPDDASRLALL